MNCEFIKTTHSFKQNSVKMSILENSKYFDQKYKNNTQVQTRTSQYSAKYNQDFN